MKYFHLLQPIKIGSIQIKNRIVMSPLTTNYADENTGYVNDQLVEYYRARAIGGVGMVIVEGAIVREDGRGFRKQLKIDTDQTIKGLSRLATAIKESGSKAILQIMHHGRQTRKSYLKDQPVAPSAIPCPVYKEMPKELTKEEIKEIQNCFVEAAKRAELAGFDGVEFHAAHGYLISGFLSKWSNMRKDEYGGSLENRLRFLTEILSETKKLVNKDFAILCRLSANEYVENGLETNEVKKIAKFLEENHVDGLDISAGVAVTFDKMSPPTGSDETPYADIVAEIKNEVSVPVISVARILTPSKANEIISEKKTDMVALGRTLVADPDWANKAIQNKADEIIPCIGCNICNGRSSSPEVICFLNPFTGKEYKWKVDTGKTEKKIAVVGNGITGYHLSILLKQAGHQVTIFPDPTIPFGGLTALRANVPVQSKDLRNVLNFYSNMIEKYDVNVETLDILQEDNYDLVINTMVKLVENEAIDIPWSQQIKESLIGSQVVQMDAIEILMGDIPKTKRVHIIGGNLLGCETAAFLADKGFQVTVVEEKKRVPYDTGNTILKLIRDEFAHQGVEIKRPSEMISFEHDTTVVWPTYPNTYEILGKGLISSNSIPLIEIGDSYLPDKMAKLMEKATEMVITSDNSIITTIA